MLLSDVVQHVENMGSTAQFLATNEIHLCYAWDYRSKIGEKARRIRRIARRESSAHVGAMAFDADSQAAALTALIDYAKAAGAEASEASLAARESISAEVRMGELEGMEREEGRSVALRAFIGKRQAAASSTDLSSSGLKALAERVVAMARAAPEDKYCGLLEEKYLTRDKHPELDQADAARPSPQQLLELAKICEAASLQIPGIANSGGGGASSEVSTFAYATSSGFEGGETGTSYSLGTQPIA